MQWNCYAIATQSADGKRYKILSSITPMFRLKGRTISAYKTAYAIRRFAPQPSAHFAFATPRQNVAYAGNVICKMSVIDMRDNRE